MDQIFIIYLADSFYYYRKNELSYNFLNYQVLKRCNATCKETTFNQDLTEASME